MNILRFVDKVDMVDKKVENLTRGKWIPFDSMKSWNYFRNYNHKIVGMGCIDSDKFNPVYLVGSYFKKLGWELSESNEVILGLKELLLLNSISQK